MGLPRPPGSPIGNPIKLQVASLRGSGLRRAEPGSRRGRQPSRVVWDSKAFSYCCTATPSRPWGAATQELSHKHWSRRLRWAREELNLRPLPCQQNTGNRCARSRSPRSPPTIDAEGKRSLDVQGNALFRHADSAATCIAPPPGCVPRIERHAITPLWLSLPSSSCCQRSTIAGVISVVFGVQREDTTLVPLVDWS